MTQHARLPEVGSDVHYVAYGTPGGEYPRACRAARIIDVPFAIEDAKVSLSGMDPSGTSRNTSHFHGGEHVGSEQRSTSQLCGSRDYPGGTWHWPHEEI